MHGSQVSAALKPFHENLEKRFKEMKTKTAHLKRVKSLRLFSISCLLYLKLKR